MLNNNMKRIVIDFDDTISIAVNRNWHDAVPNGPVVAKMRELKQQGWTIDIFTARGSISCKSRNEASRKYRMDIINWLQRYDVPFDGLSFDKPLATYYVDDKAMLPHEFANLEIENSLVAYLVLIFIVTVSLYLKKTTMRFQLRVGTPLHHPIPI